MLLIMTISCHQFTVITAWSTQIFLVTNILWLWLLVHVAHGVSRYYVVSHVHCCPGHVTTWLGAQNTRKPQKRGWFVQLNGATGSVVGKTLQWKAMGSNLILSHSQYVTPACQASPGTPVSFCLPLPQGGRWKTFHGKAIRSTEQNVQA